jgi:hypothetical protein
VISLLGIDEGKSIRGVENRSKTCTWKKGHDEEIAFLIMLICHFILSDSPPSPQLQPLALADRYHGPNEANQNEEHLKILGRAGIKSQSYQHTQ